LAEVVVYEKGQVLFEAGAKSREMYIIKEGLLSIYIKKKEQIIELATLGDGEVLGEMAFFDGAPRSASAKALSETELMVVSFTDMDKQLQKLPGWLRSVISTILPRIRKANDRIKSMESTSAAGSSKSTKKSKVEPMEVIRISSYVLLTFQKYGSEIDDGYLIEAKVLEENAYRVFEIPQGKFIQMLDILQDVGLIKNENSNVHLTDMTLLQGFIKYFEEEQGKPIDERIILSSQNFSALEILVKHHGPESESPDEKGMTRSYIEDAIEIAKENMGVNIHKSYFDGLEELELVKNKKVYKNNKIGIDYKRADLHAIYPFQQIIAALFSEA
jgi:CRP-like cAMP-binding protein